LKIGVLQGGGSVSAKFSRKGTNPTNHLPEDLSVCQTFEALAH